MVSHFQWKEKNYIGNKKWELSFYFKGRYYTGTYVQTGEITWDSNEPPSKEKEQLEAYIHDLMLYHVYEDHTPPS